LVNRKLTAQQVTDTRVYQSYDVSSDHFMLSTKIKLLTRWLHSRCKQEIEARKQRFKSTSITRVQYKKIILPSSRPIFRLKSNECRH